MESRSKITASSFFPWDLQDREGGEKKKETFL